MAAQRFSGYYITKRDQGLRYEYEVSWRDSGINLVWEATIRRGPDLKGTPSGNLLSATVLDHERAVRMLVEASIEDLVGVER